MLNTESAVGGAQQAHRGLRVEQPGAGIRHLVLDRPDQLNAINQAMLLSIITELDRAAAADDVQVVVLSGAGGAFSAGGDLSFIEELANMNHGELEGTLTRLLRISSVLYALPQPTIAALSGPVVGGALGLALACDMRLASPDAEFLASFARMGLVPDAGVSWLLPQVVGDARAFELMLSARSICAAQADRIGLVSQVCSDPLATAMDLAAMIARRPRRAVLATKRLVRQSRRMDLAAAVDAEARAQTAAMTGSEFAENFESWRAHRSID